MSVPDFTAVALGIVGLGWAASLATFALISLREHEFRAARIAALAAVGGSAGWFVLAFSPPIVRLSAVVVVAIGVVGAGLLFVLPIGRRRPGNGRPRRRVDERDIMFARARMRPGSPAFESYYAMHPDRRELDDRFRALPGLLSPDAPFAEPRAFASAKASFSITKTLREDVDGDVAPRHAAGTEVEWAAHVKDLALRLGAIDVGITDLQPYHVYTHVGRGTGTWGDPIPVEHRRAIAFTVEMDHAAMRHAPHAPVVAESARQYVESGKIAIHLASFIRSLGYPARAHIDGNYRVIAPLVGRDAGLGEIGRMGILMTPRLGPRVRLGVVTTDLPMVTDPPGDDPAVIDFCTICRKCADNCPSRSIPTGDRTAIDDGLRWTIDPDSCFRYWCAVGTDCGRCMAICPYSHPDNLAHNVVRGAIRRSGAARRAALWLDDLFYGRRPKPALPAPPGR